jgi:hypothetical protein
LKYLCDYFEHIVHRLIVFIRSLNWLTWYLLVVPHGRRATYFSHCGGVGLCNGGQLRQLLLLCVTG